MRLFSTVWLISLDRLMIIVKILSEMHICTTKFPLNFGHDLDQTVSASGPVLPWRRSALSRCFCSNCSVLYGLLQLCTVIV